MRITLLIIILSKEKGGSGFFLLFFLLFIFFSVLAQPRMQSRGSILAVQFKDPVCVLLSNVAQLSPAVVICQHLVPGIWQSISLLSMMCYSTDAEEEVDTHWWENRLLEQQISMLIALVSSRLVCAALAG